MSCQGTWADAIIIQAVANCLNLSIHIAESNATFSPVTVIEPVNVTNAINIYIGHLDEFHYVSTVENRTMEMRDNSKQTNNADENKPVDDSEKRKAYKRQYMRKYMKDRRADDNFRKNENQKRVQGSNINSKTSRNKKHQAAKRRKLNPEHVREIERRSFRKRKADNPQHVRQINKQSVRKRQKAEALASVSQLTYSSHELQPQENKYDAISVINLFHKNIASGPEYVCTCCDQLWFKCSVVKCDANKYKTCSPDIVESCLTGFKSVNETEWICITCNSTLKKGRLPSCSKANKMGFPYKPDVLNLTSLEERLISPRIPFMQIRELPCLFMETLSTYQLM